MKYFKRILIIVQSNISLHCFFFTFRLGALKVIVEKMNKLLGTESKSGKQLQQLMALFCSPAPLHTMEQAQVYELLRDATKQLNVYGILESELTAASVPGISRRLTSLHKYGSRFCQLMTTLESDILKSLPEFNKRENGDVEVMESQKGRLAVISQPL